jgi:neutral ceramidase
MVVRQAGRVESMSNVRGSLRAAAIKVDITPTDLSGLTNLWRTPLEGVHDPIYLRALVVENGIHIAAIVAADLVEFGDTQPLRQRIENEIGIPASHILITASHDHNAPRAGQVTPGATAQVGGPATQSYTDFVYDKLVEAVRQAKAALLPARVGVGSGEVDVNTNRDVYTPQGWKLGTNPDGPSDKTVWAIKFESLAGEPIAILMNYAVHSVVLGPQNRLITGDLAGAAERTVEEFFQDRLVALWTMGAAGDQNPRFMDGGTSLNVGVPIDDYAMMEAQGRLVGAEVIRVASQIERMAEKVQISIEERIVSCPAKLPENKHSGMMVEQVDSIKIRLAVILLNQIAITGVSGEVVTNIYRHLRRLSPFSSTLMITIANDRIGYILDDAGYDTPTFAAMATPLQRGYAEAAIVNGLVEMLDRC